MKDEQQSANRRARNAAPKNVGSSNPDSEFVNLELDKEQTAAFRQWRSDAELVLELWDKLIEEGYRVNSKWDDYSNACAVFVIPGPGSENTGYILTGRGGTAFRALSEALYKHEFVLQGLWGNLSKKDRREYDPDF